MLRPFLAHCLSYHSKKMIKFKEAFPLIFSTRYPKGSLFKVMSEFCTEDKNIHVGPYFSRR